MLDITTQSFDSQEVAFAIQNGYWLKANTVATKAGKKLSHYWDSKDTKEYIEAVLEQLNAKDLSYPKINEPKIYTEEDLKKVVLGKGKEQGTWVHPRLSVHFARWISARFAVFCDEFVSRELRRKSKIREDVLIEQLTQEKIEAVEEEKKLNSYTRNNLEMVTIGKWVELTKSTIHRDVVASALKAKNWMVDEIKPTIFRRLHPECPSYVGSVISGTKNKGTPLYSVSAINQAVMDYLEAAEEVNGED